MTYLQFCAAMLCFFNVKSELQWQVLNKNISQKSTLSVLLLDLKFSKKIGFSLSEYYE
jgi:hypothetical protein